MTARLLSYVDAAAYLSLPVGTLRSLVCRRQIPHVRITARLVKFDPADLDAWIKNGRREAKPKPRRGPSERHEALLDRVLPGLPRRGFVAALRDVVGAPMDANHRFAPDAFDVNVEARSIAMYEAVVTHDIDDRKLGKIRLLRQRVVSAGWSIRLFVVSEGSSEGIEIDIETGCVSDDDMRRGIERLPFSGALAP